MAIQMQLSRILIADTRDYQLIELREVDGEHCLAGAALAAGDGERLDHASELSWSRT